MAKLKRKPPGERITCITYPEPGAMGETGKWRIFRPVVDREKCNKCQICWMYCPDAVITLDEEGIPKMDLVYCKGCLICEQVCPAKAITRIRETEAKE